MNDSLSPPGPGWAVDLKETFRQLQEETILLAITGLALVGTILMACSALVPDPRWTVATSFGLYGLAGLVSALRRRSFRLASWTLVLGLLGTVGLALWGGGVELAVVFLIVPVGCLTLTLDAQRGLGLCALLTILLALLPQAWLPVSPLLRGVSAAAVWFTLAMIWLTLRPLLQAVQWAWSGYLSGQGSLQQAREFQAQLQQSLGELRETNAQMMRLNQLTQNLRLMAENEQRVKEEFVANVSHELRTPLNMIVGFCDMILNSPETYGDSIPPALLADLEVVLRNSRHLSSLIDDVLDLSQIDAGRMALAREWIAFGEIVQDAVIAVRPLVESKNLALSLDIPPDLPRVWCDRIRIREVLLNLLSNAGRFTERGGIVVQCRVEGRHLQVSVADTGPGITQEDTTRLFKPFQQLDSSIRRRYGGTGLGLSISKGFVELHDGEMWVESRKGQGTTFFFKIPLRPVDLPESGPARWLSPYLPHEETPRVPGRESEPVRARLVVVEAGNVMYKLLHRYLPQVEPVPARTLQEGLAMLEQQHAVALLVNQDGVERAAAMIQESGKLPFSIPAILCSIPGTEGAGLGAAGYLVKPVDRGRLLDELGSLDRPVETILVVDDEPDARQLFRRMLASSEQGYRVIRASNGLEALEKMRQEQVDAVLLDLVMPGMDGFQFLVEKNNDAALREIPVILISARDPSGHPIASNALTILRGGGISMKQVVASIETTLALMAPLGPTDPAPPAAPSG